MSVPSSPPTRFDQPDDETDRLIAELRARGIAYLSGGHDAAIVAEAAVHPLADSELLRRLASCAEPRVRNATVALFLLHPELASVAVEAMRRADAETAQRLAVVLLAALYLLHLWRTRLRLALGREPQLPEPSSNPSGDPATCPIPHTTSASLACAPWRTPSSAAVASRSASVAIGKIRYSNC
ncbi:MAG: hypothetical protein ACRDHP_19550 [Ktedonobacterales bacterium]